MSATMSNIADTYRLDLTREQWEALSSVITHAQHLMAADVRECEASEAFWLKQGEDDDGRRLTLARKNLATRRQWLTEARSLAPVVHGATVVPARRRSR